MISPRTPIVVKIGGVGLLGVSLVWAYIMVKIGYRKMTGKGKLERKLSKQKSLGAGAKEGKTNGAAAAPGSPSGGVPLGRTVSGQAAGTLRRRGSRKRPTTTYNEVRVCFRQGEQFSSFFCLTSSSTHSFVRG